MTAPAFCALAALIALTALGAAFVLWHRTRRTLLRLNQMLEDAIRGEFREEAFNEGLLSALEAKFAHFISAASVSALSLREERDKIKVLIADISHQTKTPLANLLLYTQLLDEQGAMTEALEAQVRKLQSLIDALVKISRLEAGMLVLHPEAGSVREVLEKAAAQFRPRAEEKGLALSLGAADAEAVFDPKWTEEAVCCLIDNAVKYTPSGRVTVSARAYELFTRIDVEDTGPGIPEEELGKVFQRFYRGAGASQAEGVGVGLCLARQIAEGQGGYVKVSSKPGHGARFSLFLPR